MTNLIESVKCSITIIFKDDTSVNINLATAGSKDNITNYVTSLSIDESTNTQNNMPVGVVSANTLKIELNSNDRSLFPENVNSIYYGLMDSTATIKVSLEDVDGIVEFNTFYVSNWRSNVNANEPNKVIIECTDLMSIICKNKVPSGVITDDLSTKEAFLYLLNKLNEQLDNKHQIEYNDNDIIFNVFDNIEYDNLDTGSMSDWLNTLSQCTLTNIYFARDGKIKTDYCLDDTIKESVGTLSDKINITDASVDSGGLVKYTGVQTNYITNTLNNTGLLNTINNQLVKASSVETFDNLNLNNKVFRITAVRLKSDIPLALRILSLSYDKRTCSIEIENMSDIDANCNIEIYGQSLKENTASVTRGEGSTNEMLEVTNKLILPEDVELYTSNLLSLIGIRNSSLQLTGFFNPRLKLGDTVYVDVEKSIQASGYYKIIGLQWKISNIIKCTAKLIKTIVEEA